MRLALAAMALAALPTTATANVTATATRTQDPSVVQVRMHVTLKAKRPLERSVYAYACQDTNEVLACTESPVAHKVKLHKGQNRLTVKLRVQAMRPGLGPVPEGWDGNPADRSFLVPMLSADVVYYWFGQSAIYKSVRPLNAAMFGEALKEEETP